MKAIAAIWLAIMTFLPTGAAAAAKTVEPVETTEEAETADRVEAADIIETGPNISGESDATERRQIFKDSSIQKDADVRIEVPRRPDGRPQRPVRGLNRTEKMELDDLEYRYQMGQIGDAEYYSRRHAIMERLGLEPEY